MYLRKSYDTKIDTRRELFLPGQFRGYARVEMTGVEHILSSRFAIARITDADA